MMSGSSSFQIGYNPRPFGVSQLLEKGTECCSWIGVNCMTGDRVTALRIIGSTLGSESVISGTISPSLAKLQHLDGFYFAYHPNITGSFPQFLFQLPKLKYVDLRSTSLSGPLPANMGALSQLEEFLLLENQFTGPIPTSIYNMTRLTWLHFFGNRFSGTIPDIFKSMTKLEYLDLSRNRFSGKLPSSIESLAPSLKYLDLSQNNLSGTIPNLFSRFEALSVDLSKNQFSGVVPKSFANMSKLDLSHNLLSGQVPELKFVEYLDLSYNQYHLKTIPKWVTLSPSIVMLKLVKCGIKMRFDDWKPKRTKDIGYIDLSENEISGSPQLFLNQAERLVEFLASGNKLRFDMGKLKFAKSLRILDLSRNLVFGKVPAKVAGLLTLNLSQNHLCGKLPVTRFPASVFAGNHCLCGSPLSPCKA